MSKFLAIILISSSFIGFLPIIEGQDYALNAPNTSALPGGNVAVDIIMDNAAESQGFQFGINFDPALLTLTSLTQGSDLHALRGGQVRITSSSRSLLPEESLLVRSSAWVHPLSRFLQFRSNDHPYGIHSPLDFPPLAFLDHFTSSWISPVFVSFQ